MQPVSTITKLQIEQLRKVPMILKYIFDTTPAAELTTWRDGGDGWTALEVLAHLRDFDAIFIKRVRLALDEDSPLLPFPNPVTLAQEGRYNEQNPQAVYAEWAAGREALLALFGSIDESQWARPAQHPVRGIVSVYDQLIIAVWHDNNHLEQITRTLVEKKNG